MDIYSIKVPCPWPVLEPLDASVPTGVTWLQILPPKLLIVLPTTNSLLLGPYIFIQSILMNSAHSYILKWDSLCGAVIEWIPWLIGKCCLSCRDRMKPLCLWIMWGHMKHSEFLMRTGIYSSCIRRALRMLLSYRMYFEKYSPVFWNLFFKAIFRYILGTTEWQDVKIENLSWTISLDHWLYWAGLGSLTKREELPWATQSVTAGVTAQAC